MRHVIVAGSAGKFHQATWSSKTGELHGDAPILDRARSMKTITVHLHDGEQTIDWKDSATAVPALMDAAQATYGRPIGHFIHAEEGDEPPVRPSVSNPPLPAA
jgi:hypothetical protein